MSFGTIAAAAAPALIGGLAGAFGGSRQNTNPYAGQVNAAANQLGDVAGAFGGIGKTATGDYNNYSQSARAANAQYAGYLQSDPYTDQYSTARINQATNGTNAAYMAAKSNLSAELARRGLGGDSSTLAGGLAGIESARANTIGTAQNNLALEASNARGQRLGQLNALQSGAAQNAFGDATQSYGGADAAYGKIGSLYSGLNEQANQQANIANGQQAQAIGQFAGGLGQLFAGRPGAYKAPAAPNDPNDVSAYDGQIAAFTRQQTDAQMANGTYNPPWRSAMMQPGDTR